MILLKDPKNMLVLLFIAMMLSFIFIIAHHNQSDAYCQQKIDGQSQIN
jgi:hypothetical protein